MAEPFGTPSRGLRARSGGNGSWWPAASGTDQARDRVGRLLDLGRGITGTRRIDDAVRQVVLQQADGDRLQGALGRGNLRQNVDAVGVFIDHPLQATDLPLDAPEAPE